MLYGAIHVSTDVWPILQVVMRRIAIIDHITHTLMVEDINEDELKEKYGDDGQKYVDDNYTFEGDYSWDWITDTQYFSEDYSIPVEINFEKVEDI